mmetsp:Transcript_50588/g.158053  ORF Transcript_50588/g.158053 Transcript_50588/m.158053 type:complete len:187 (-) Transcript_50588:727-1287(-)
MKQKAPAAGKSLIQEIEHNNQDTKKKPATKSNPSRDHIEDNDDAMPMLMMFVLVPVMVVVVVMMMVVRSRSRSRSGSRSGSRKICPSFVLTDDAGKGTTDYSKWDEIDSDEEEEAVSGLLFGPKVDKNDARVKDALSDLKVQQVMRMLNSTSDEGVIQQMLQDKDVAEKIQLLMRAGVVDIKPPSK